MVEAGLDPRNLLKVSNQLISLASREMMFKSVY